MQLVSSENRLAAGPVQILIDSRDSAAAQMAMDEALARTARATFRLFRWQRPAVSLGFKQPPPAWVEPGALAGQGIEVVERPTGGGIAVHGSDLSFSVVAPQALRWSLHNLLEAIAEALEDSVRQFGVEVAWVAGDAAAGPATSRIAYCLTQESPYALMVGGRKLCGLALRRYQASWLIQGSLLAGALPAVFAQVMPAEVFGAFQARAITLEEAAGRTIVDEELIAALVQAWRTTMD